MSTIESPKKSYETLTDEAADTLLNQTVNFQGREMTLKNAGIVIKNAGEPHQQEMIETLANLIRQKANEQENYVITQMASHETQSLSRTARDGIVNKIIKKACDNVNYSPKAKIFKAVFDIALGAAERTTAQQVRSPSTSGTEAHDRPPRAKSPRGRSKQAEALRKQLEEQSSASKTPEAPRAAARTIKPTIASQSSTLQVSTTTQTATQTRVASRQPELGAQASSVTIPTEPLTLSESPTLSPVVISVSGPSSPESSPPPSPKLQASTAETPAQAAMATSQPQIQSSSTRASGPSPIVRFEALPETVQQTLAPLKDIASELDREMSTHKVTQKQAPKADSPSFLGRMWGATASLAKRVASSSWDKTKTVAALARDVAVSDVTFVSRTVFRTSQKINDVVAQCIAHPKACLAIGVSTTMFAIWAAHDNVVPISIVAHGAGPGNAGNDAFSTLPNGQQIIGFIRDNTDVIQMLNSQATS